MLDPQKTLEREALLKRHRELEAEIAQHERNLREGEARLRIVGQKVESAVSWAELQPHPLAFHHPASKSGSLFAKVFNRFLWMLGFWSVDADEAHTFSIMQNQRIPIDFTLHQYGNYCL
jgi:hypothetical protein